MSYQFEDDSALEELLNQQLDRRKQQSISRFQQPSRPSTAAATTTPPTAPSKQQNAPSSVSARPSTASQASSTGRPPPPPPHGLGAATDAGGTQATPRGKLSSWLEAPRGSQAAAPSGGGGGDQTSVLPASQEAPRRQSLQVIGVADTHRAMHPQQQTLYSSEQLVADPNERGNPIVGEEQRRQLVELANQEDRLQEMSKQRLIQLIVGQLGPLLGQLYSSSRDNSSQKLAELRHELELERNRTKLAEATHTERIQLEEQKWRQIVGQLEARLATSQSELNSSVQSQREHLDRLEREQREHLAKIIENYEQKLSHEKVYFEELLQRRDQLHELEMESKFKINCNLQKLETYQEQWARSLAATIKQLEGQYKSVEALLEQQALQVEATNSSLLEKSRSLGSQLDRQSATAGKLDQLATDLGALLPSVGSLRAESDEILVKTSHRLEELLQRDAQLADKEQQVDTMRGELAGEREQLASERLRIAVESERLAMREERVAELVGRNESLEAQLAGQRSQQLELDRRLEATRLALDAKANELREQNYDLHVARRKLNGQRDELIRDQGELARRRQSLEDQVGKFRDDTRKLAAFRNQVRRELSQLTRLQKSLVCSLCLSRLFKSAGGWSGTATGASRSNLNPSSVQLINVHHKRQKDTIAAVAATDKEVDGTRTKLADLLTPRPPTVVAPSQGNYDDGDCQYDDDDDDDCKHDEDCDHTDGIELEPIAGRVPVSGGGGGGAKSRSPFARLNQRTGSIRQVTASGGGLRLPATGGDELDKLGCRLERDRRLLAAESEFAELVAAATLE